MASGRPDQARQRQRYADRVEYLYRPDHDHRRHAAGRQRRQWGLDRGTSSVLDNGRLAFSHSDPQTLAVAVSGSGGLTQAGTGNSHPLGSNTYSGGTTISEGTLQVGNGGGAWGTTGAVLDNGTLARSRSDTATFAGVISGFGRLGGARSGTWVLTGANTFSGAMMISSGTLQLGGSGSIAGTSGVLDNGSLAFSRSNALTFAAVVSGSGSLTQAGTGNLTLAGGNTFSGVTTISSGSLTLANPLALQNSTLGTGGSGTLSFGSLTCGHFRRADRFTNAQFGQQRGRAPLPSAWAIITPCAIGDTPRHGEPDESWQRHAAAFRQQQLHGWYPTINAGTLEAAGTGSLPGFATAGKTHRSQRRHVGRRGRRQRLDLGEHRLAADRQRQPLRQRFHVGHRHHRRKASPMA